jgi:hypothetical protein
MAMVIDSKEFFGHSGEQAQAVALSGLMVEHRL